MSQELEGTLTNTADLVGTFGSEGGGGTSNYNDLINKPSINSVTLQGNKTASQLGFATVATSGAYSDLTGTPTIPAAQVNSDWNASSGVAEILNKPTVYQNASSLPISSSDSTDTKTYIDTGLSSKQATLTTTATTDTANGQRLSGGYIQIGNIVYVDINIELLSSTDYTKALQTGLPTPIDNKNVQIIGNNYDTWDYQPNAVLYGFRLANGGVYHNANSPMASGTKLHIFGSYITA